MRWCTTIVPLLFTINTLPISLQASRQQRKGQGQREKEEGTLLDSSSTLPRHYRTLPSLALFHLWRRFLQLHFNPYHPLHIVLGSSPTIDLHPPSSVYSCTISPLFPTFLAVCKRGSLVDSERTRQSHQIEPILHWPLPLSSNTPPTTDPLMLVGR